MARAAQGSGAAAASGARGANGAANGGGANGGGGAAALGDDPFAMILRQLHRSHEARRGLPPLWLDRLPSYTFRETSSPSKNDNGDGNGDEEQTTDANRTCRSLVFCFLDIL